MRKFRRILLDFVKMLIRSRPLFPIVCGGVFLSLSPIGRIGNKEYNIVVLDRERFWPGDLERLAERNNLWEMSSSVRGILHSLFFVGGELGVLRTGVTKPEFDYKAECFKKYIGRVFSWLSSKRRIDFVMTCNYSYVQNRLLARALRGSPIKFIDLHRESKQDLKVFKRFKDKYKKQSADLRFEGDYLLVYNKDMKSLALELEVTDSSRIKVVGVPRIDSLILRANCEHSLPFKKQQVTLFSFREMPLGDDERDYPQGFSQNRDRGLVQLFDRVHSTFAMLASSNPEVRFVVKTKWRGTWIDRIENAFRNGLNGNPAPKNLIILSEEVDAIEEIFRSNVIIGLNSMTLVQSRLAGRPVIVPLFAEIEDKYPDAVQYRDLMSEFIVANSESEINENVQSCLGGSLLRVPAKKGIFDSYVGPTDSRNLDRFQASLLESQLSRP